MAATGINHVTIVTRDLDEAERFYGDLVAAERVESPNFGARVRWLRVGDVQIHLLNVPEEAGGAGHFGITVDDLAPVYEKARELGIFDAAVNGHYFWRLPDDVAQLYIRDPSGNLVEINMADSSRLPESVRADLRVVADVQPQDESNLRAKLLMAPRG
jgi:catechol 2,3-dioxygenase-like lactoylglutathione lyase family enzyme